jgi:hypothetical protein
LTLISFKAKAIPNMPCRYALSASCHTIISIVNRPRQIPALSLRLIRVRECDHENHLSSGAGREEVGVYAVGVL